VIRCQEPALFSTTIAENIAYGAIDPSTVTVQQITNAARMANAQNFIDRFPKGLETVVGERGVMLSGELSFA
jgi:ATP-binding cassette, subfamily B (MDR/TAP), member 10